MDENDNSMEIFDIYKTILGLYKVRKVPLKQMN